MQARANVRRATGAARRFIEVGICCICLPAPDAHCPRPAQLVPPSRFATRTPAPQWKQSGRPRRETRVRGRPRRYHTRPCHAARVARRAMYPRYSRRRQLQRSASPARFSGPRVSVPGAPAGLRGRDQWDGFGWRTQRRRRAPLPPAGRTAFRVCRMA